MASVDGMQTIKFIDGPPPENGFFDDGSNFEQAENNFENPSNLGTLYNSPNTANWDETTPMTGSHIPGVDTGARGGQTTFMGSTGQVETIGSGAGSFSGGSTPYESIMRDHLLNQLPDNPDNSVVCNAGSPNTDNTAETVAGTLAIGGSALEGSGLATHYGSEWFETPEWTQYLGKATPWLEEAGHALGWAGVFVEGGDGTLHGDYTEMGHATVDGAVLGISTFVGGPIGFVLGAAWTGVDQYMQHYTFQGQHGWSAFTNSQAWTELQNEEIHAQDIRGFNAANPVMQRFGLIPR